MTMSQWGFRVGSLQDIDGSDEWMRQLNNFPLDHDYEPEEELCAVVLGDLALGRAQAELDGFQDVGLVEVEHWMVHVCQLLQ